MMRIPILQHARPSRRVLIALAGATIVFVAASVSLSPAARSADGADASPVPSFAGPVSFADVVEKVSPAVVNIAVEKLGSTMPTRLPGSQGRGTPFDDFFGRFFEMPQSQIPQRQPRSQALGSGFVVDADGYIVTNHHVIDGANKVMVRFANGEEAEAVVVGRDPKTDLALIKVDTVTPLPSVEFGDSDRTRVGDWVLAIGNPFGLGGSATAGIVSARGRDIQSGPYDDYLQIDAPINSGNSGGPVFDAAGQVIGVNTAIYSPNGGNIGIGFAIPARQAAAVIAALKAEGSVTRGWLGVQIQALDDDLIEALGVDDGRGALVAEIVANSPAAEAGLRPGDVITRFNNEEVDDAKHLGRIVANARPGDAVEVEIVRDGRTRELAVSLGNVDTPLTAARSPSNSGNLSGGDNVAAGLTLAALTPEHRERLGIAGDTPGALVVAVQAGSMAQAKGIRPGDVIAAVNHRDAASVADVVAALQQAQSNGDRALLLMRRGAAQLYVALSFA